jgi:hypothetical protein
LAKHRHRSAARELRNAGVPESTIMDIGGWKTREMFKRYAITDSKDIAAAITKRERAQAENSQISAMIRLLTPQQKLDQPLVQLTELLEAAGIRECPGTESNRHDSFESRDFKSRASASFATRASRCTSSIL